MHESWRKQKLRFLQSQERDLLLNHDMFETNCQADPDAIETLESRLMKEKFGVENQPTEVTKDMVMIMI